MSRCLPAILLACLPASALAAEEAWRLDPVHTQIHFSVDHLGFTHAMGLFKVREGLLQFDPADLTRCRVDVTVDVGSLLMGDSKWQETVTSWQFLNIKRWPLARYTAQHCEKTADNEGVVQGSLELHGESAPLALRFRLNKVGNDPYSFRHTAGFSAQGEIQRSTYGMNKLLTAVGDKIELRIEMEAVRDRGGSHPAAGDRPPEPAATENSEDAATQ